MSEPFPRVDGALCADRVPLTEIVASVGTPVFVYSASHIAETYDALDAATQARLDRGYRMTELLKQGLYQPLHVTDQVLSIYAGTHGHLDKIDVEEVHAWEAAFLQFIHEQKNELWQKITDSRQMDDESAEELEQAIEEFQKTYIGQKEEATATV